MKKQNGLTLTSTLFVGVLLVLVLLLFFKLIPVFSEYFAVKKALNNVVKTVDVGSPPSAFRAAFGRFADIDDIESLDPQTIVVTKENGKAHLSADYRREVKLFSNVSLAFDFAVESEGSAAP